MIGEVYDCQGEISIYDCVSNVVCSAFIGRGQHSGGIIGLAQLARSIQIENTVATMDNTSTLAQDSGVLGCFWDSSARIKNCYVEGKYLHLR